MNKSESTAQTQTFNKGEFTIRIIRESHEGKFSPEDEDVYVVAAGKSLMEPSDLRELAAALIDAAKHLEFHRDEDSPTTEGLLHSAATEFVSAYDSYQFSAPENLAALERLNAAHRAVKELL